MDNRIEDPSKHMADGNVNHVIPEPMDLTELKQIAAELQQSSEFGPLNLTEEEMLSLLKHVASPVTDHRAPSITALGDLTSIQLRHLQPHTRHQGSVIYLRICAVTKQSGAIFDVRDGAGTQGQLWSLLIRPFGGKGSDYAENTVVAVKEPCLAMRPTGELMVRVDHPTDVVWVSKFEPVVAHIFPALAKRRTSDKDYCKEGDEDFLKGATLSAIDAYSRGIALCQARDSANSCHLANLLQKRLFAYSRLENHDAACGDAVAVLNLNLSTINLPAMMLGCASAIEAGKLGMASEIVGKLNEAHSSHRSVQSIAARFELHRRQVVGDFDFSSLAPSISARRNNADASNYVGNVEMRDSPLGGQGTFSNRSVQTGTLLLCERAVAVAYTNGDYTKEGLEGIVPDPATNGRKLALIQDLVSKTCAQPALRQGLFNLHAGDSIPDLTNATPSELVFNTRRALDIINYNAHAVFPGKTSDTHDLNDAACDPPLSLRNQITAEDQVPGLWLRLSKINHSCVPNAVWSWLGDLIVLRAAHDIAAGEEITIAYVPTTYEHDKRQDLLQRQNGSTCTCEKCLADAALSASQTEARSVQPPGPQAPSSPSSLAYPQALEDAVRKQLRTFPPRLYASLPYLEAATPLYRLAHAYLGPLSSWSSASSDKRSKARDCFTACLELGCNILLLHDPSKPPYYSIHVRKHGRPKTMAVLALMGLAELAFVEGGCSGKARAAALRRCAREVYGISYGEVETFGEKHVGYKCRYAREDAVASVEVEGGRRRN